MTKALRNAGWASHIGAISDRLEFRAGIWRSRSRGAYRYSDQISGRIFGIEDGSFWFQHRNRCILRMMKLFPPGGAVLDVGGGNGFVTRALEASGIPVVLLEPGARAVANARQRGIRRIIRSTFEEAGIKANKLTAVGVFDVLEHTGDERAFLKSIHDSLQAGGRLYLTAPAYSWLWSGYDRQAGHLGRYTLKSLRSLLGGTGYAVEFQSYLFSALVVPLFFVRSVPAAFQSLIAPENASAIDPGRHHGDGQGGRVLRRILDWECGRIGRRRAVPFGTSCLVVARKPGGRAGS